MAEQNNKKRRKFRLITFILAAALAGSILTALVFITSNFAVKDTNGINQFIGDQKEVERVALKLKQRFGNPNSTEYKIALDAYDHSVLASDKYIQEIKLEAKLHQLVDVSIDDYETSLSGVKAAFDAFIETGNDMLGTSATGLELVNESSDFAFDLLDKVIKLKDEESEKAVKRLNNTLNNAYMIEYIELSRSKLLEKYRNQ